MITSRRHFTCALCVATAVLLTATGLTWAQRPAGDAALLPPEGFAGGWKKSGPLKVFTSADLYGYIDGGAEAFLEIGFEQLTVQKYLEGANELTVELYRMTDATAARGVYLARCGKETPDPALRERHTASRHQILLQRQRYYLVLSNTAGGAANAPILATAARVMAAKMPADTPVPALALLPPGLAPGSARLFRGPVGLQAVYTLGEGDILQLGGNVTGVSGDYRDASGGAGTLVVVEYPTPAAAAAAFKHLKSNLDSYLKPAGATDGRLVFRDYEKKFGVATVDGPRLEVRLHLAKPPA